MSLRLKLALAVAVLSLAPARRPRPEARQGRQEVARRGPARSCSPTRRRRSATSRTRRTATSSRRSSGRGAIPTSTRPTTSTRTPTSRRAPEVDRQFKVARAARAPPTDCGRVYLLLGKPDEMKPDKPVGRRALAASAGESGPTATVRARPSRAARSRSRSRRTASCPQGARLGEQLNKVAESKIVHPNLAYQKGPDGKLVKLVDQLPKPSPAQALLKAPRQDFPVATQNAMMLLRPGRRHLRGRPRARAPGVPRDPGAKMQPVNVVVAQAVDAQGRTSAQKERLVSGEFAEDGSVVASYGMTLAPGQVHAQRRRCSIPSRARARWPRSRSSPRPQPEASSRSCRSCCSRTSRRAERLPTRRTRWRTSSSAPTAWRRRSTTCSRSRAR